MHVSRYGGVGTGRPTMVLDGFPEMLYERVSAGKRMWSPGFARLALERLCFQRMSEGGSDS